MTLATQNSPDIQLPEAEVPTLTYPLSWLLEHAAPAIAYRAYTEVAEYPPVAGMDNLPYTAPLGVALGVMQSVDGSWNDLMLAPPQGGDGVLAINGVGTIFAVRRLLEYGWDPQSPSLLLARRVLFRLLAEDDDPRMLYELGVSVTSTESAIWARNILREAAAATLAQAGYEADPRLRGAARRIMERVDAFLASDLASKPWIRIGNRHVIAEEANPPSIHTLIMLSHMPIFRNEHYPEMERLYEYLTQSKPTQEIVQVVGEDVLPQPHLVLGDLLHNKNVVDADVPFALLWLETMARFGFLKRNDNWLKMFERLVADRDRQGVWHPHKGEDIPETSSPFTWPLYPLDVPQADEKRWTDVTFRIGLIARLLGWRIEIV